MEAGKVCVHASAVVVVVVVVVVCGVEDTTTVVVIVLVLLELVVVLLTASRALVAIDAIGVDVLLVDVVAADSGTGVDRVESNSSLTKALRSRVSDEFSLSLSLSHNLQ